MSNHKDNNFNNQWIDICAIEDIPTMTGVCALHQKKQIAIFNLSSIGENSQLNAIDNFDPIGKANVLSRGIVAEIDGRQTVSSPLFKQHYCLATGECLQDHAIKVDVYPVRLKNSRVQLQID